MNATEKMQPPLRLAALRRFALAITVLTLLGHTLLGFEQSYAQPLCCLATTYSLELLLEYVGACIAGKVPAFLDGGPSRFINFLLPAHISGLAIGMLLYASDRILPFVCAAIFAIGSKALFRVTTAHGRRHFFNPSNFGITLTLLLFPSVGIAPPYMFTEGLNTVFALLLPALIITTGLMLNAKFTHRLPLILGWVGSFVLQAIGRHLEGEALFPVLNAMTGVAFILFTFYMIADPATTPIKPRHQVLFGMAVGLSYGILVKLHVVFGFFFALTFVCIVRGSLMSFVYWRTQSASTAVTAGSALPHSALAPALQPLRAESGSMPPPVPERMYPI